MQNEQKNLQNFQINQNKIISSKFELVQIGPFLNDSIIPTKIPSPFHTDPIKWNKAVDKIIDSYFEHSNSSFPIFDFSFIVLASSTTDYNKICEYTIEKINNSAIKKIKMLIGLQNLTEIKQSIVSFQNSINSFIKYFAVIQKERINFEKSLYSTISHELKEKNAFFSKLSSLAVQIILDALNINTQLNDEDKLIFVFIEKSNIIQEVFNQPSSNSLINNFKELGNTEKIIKSFDSFNIFYHSFPKEATKILKYICQLFSSNAIASNTIYLVENNGLEIIKDNDKIETFLNILDPSNSIDYSSNLNKQLLSTLVNNIMSNETEITKVMIQLHKFIEGYCIYIRHILERRIKKKFIQEKHKIPIQLARMFDDFFRNGIYNEGFISLLSLIEDKDAFDALHSSLMMRRAIDLTDEEFECDKLFTKHMHNVYDDNHSNHFQFIVKDKEESETLFNEFSKLSDCNIPPFLKIHTFFWKNWYINDDHLNSYRFPAFLSEHLTSYTSFYRKKHPGTNLEWKLNASDCQLKISCINIICSGIAGTALLELNSGPKTVEEIYNATNITTDEIEGIFSRFIDSDNHKLLNYENNKYSVDKNFINSLTEDRTIKLPLELPENKRHFNVASTAQNLMSKNAIIDSIIIASLKKEKEMTKSQILDKTLKSIAFPITKEAIQERFDILEKRNFISPDPMNMNLYHYVP